MFILDAVKVTACPKKKGLKNFIDFLQKINFKNFQLGNLFYTTATLDSAYE